MARLLLASRSPRRRELLRAAGFEHAVIDAGVDDGQLSPGDSTPEQWVAALSYLKARAGWERLSADETRSALVIGADTVVEKAGAIIGQPKDEADARRIIRALSGGSHRVLTGVTLLRAADDEHVGGVAPTAVRRTFVDAACVSVGTIADEHLEAYLATGGWRGKAGGYNLSERLHDGWPITYQGDPGTVVGLPMDRLTPLLHEMLGTQATKNA